jgi:hypothetical protein
MANTFDLVGSPLGLFTLKSRPTRDGMSSFNGGKSRNINVIAYNTGKKQATNIKGKSGNTIDSPVSLFSGGSLPNFWPNIKTAGTDLDPTGSTGSYNGFSRNDLHNNDVYDTSLLNIIEKLSFSKMAAVRPQDFAYLKNLGVLPNNRLMIARRFLSPAKDNIMGKGGTAPKSILISWKPEGEDFLDISFGEEWMEAEADFTNILNKLGEEFGIGGMGSGGGKGLNLIPLPGFTEGLQRDFLVGIGILNKSGKEAGLPSGNPNLIKIAKRRKTIGYGQSGSGLKCTVSIKMTVEYEQKFISGIDPTVAWMDIMNNILVFGTSKSFTYGLSGEFRNRLDKWTSNPDSLIKDIIEQLTNAFKNIKSTIQNALNNADANRKLQADAAGSDEKAKAKAEKELAKQKLENEQSAFDEAKEGLQSFLKDLGDAAKSTLSSTIKKYKVELMGIANSLSGAPSTPWHITVGNPLRPIFCSGDMITDDVKVKLGPTLAFNDLPSNITVDFTLTNARPWGLQEILAKFNTGHLRTISLQKDFLEVNGTPPGGIYSFPPEEPPAPAQPPAGGNPGSVPPVVTPADNSTTKENDV